MKSKVCLRIVILNLWVVFMFFCLVLTMPLQILDYLITKKNRVFKYLEQKVFKMLFEVNDLKRQKKDEYK